MGGTCNSAKNGLWEYFLELNIACQFKLAKHEYQRLEIISIYFPDERNLDPTATKIENKQYESNKLFLCHVVWAIVFR